MFKFYSTKKKKETVGVSYGFGILVMTISKIGIHFDEKRLGLWKNHVSMNCPTTLQCIQLVATWTGALFVLFPHEN